MSVRHIIDTFPPRLGTSRRSREWPGSHCDGDLLYPRLGAGESRVLCSNCADEAAHCIGVLVARRWVENSGFMGGDWGGSDGVDLVD